MNRTVAALGRLVWMLPLLGAMPACAQQAAPASAVARAGLDALK
jgi:hypothetical protein